MAIESIDGSGNASFVSMAIDKNDQPHISYLDSKLKYNDLKYARRSGASWSIQNVDTVRYVGLPTSIVVDKAGNPRISYSDVGDNQGQLKYASLSVPSSFALGTINVSDIAVEPMIAAVGKPVVISVNVANSGNTATDGDVVLKVDGAVESRKRLSLAPGETSAASFAINGSSPGSHEVDVNGLKGSFTVQGALRSAPHTETPTTAVASGLSVWVFGVALAGALLVAAGVWVTVRNRRGSPGK